MSYDRRIDLLHALAQDLLDSIESLAEQGHSKHIFSGVIVMLMMLARDFRLSDDEITELVAILEETLTGLALLANPSNRNYEKKIRGLLYR